MSDHKAFWSSPFLWQDAPWLRMGTLEEWYAHNTTEELHSQQKECQTSDSIKRPEPEIHGWLKNIIPWNNTRKHHKVGRFSFKQYRNSIVNPSQLLCSYVNEQEVRFCFHFIVQVMWSSDRVQPKAYSGLQRCGSYRVDNVSDFSSKTILSHLVKCLSSSILCF